MSDEKIPEKLVPYTGLGFDITLARESGNEYVGVCPFCGKHEKFYINTVTGMYSCKIASCESQGNLYTYIRAWYERIAVPLNKAELQGLAINRGISVEDLQDFGDLVSYKGRYYIPIRNKEGEIINYRYWSIGNKIMGIRGLDSHIWNIGSLYDNLRRNDPVYICEGEWDGIAMCGQLRANNARGVVIAVPGAGMFKDAWIPPLSGREVVICYDSDDAGRVGAAKLYPKLTGPCKSVSYIKWPAGLPDEYDIRDHFKQGNTLEELLKYVQVCDSTTFETADKGRTATSATKKTSVDTRPMASAARPTFEHVLKIYRKYLHIPPELEWGLRISYAVVISVQIPGDPLWVHFVSPPGSGKTALLGSLATVMSVHFESCLTAHSLVSGWQGKGEEDPSLLPKLHGKTLVLKDFTEILQMNHGARDEIYATLRGAFDGNVRKSYGNGVTRNYDVHFNMITGVTPEIYSSSGASMGERFLMYHQIKGVGYDAEAQIEMALSNVNSSEAMLDDMQSAADSFLNFKIPRNEIPELSKEWTKRLIGLSQFVAMLRAVVPKSYGSEKLAYRPQHEMGTRIAKQLKKLLLGLAMLRYPFEITEDDYAIAVRVAMDSCIGFNLEIVAELMIKDGLTADEISQKSHIPLSTCRELLNDMQVLGVIDRSTTGEVRQGRPQYIWWVTETVERHWSNARLGNPSNARIVASIADRHVEMTRLMREKKANRGEKSE